MEGKAHFLFIDSKSAIFESRRFGKVTKKPLLECDPHSDLFHVFWLNIVITGKPKQPISLNRFERVSIITVKSELDPTSCINFASCPGLSTLDLSTTSVQNINPLTSASRLKTLLLPEQQEEDSLVYLQALTLICKKKTLTIKMGANDKTKNLTWATFTARR